MSIAIILDMAKQAKEALAQPNRLYPLNVGISAEAIIQAAEEAQEMQKEFQMKFDPVWDVLIDYTKKYNPSFNLSCEEKDELDVLRNVAALIRALLREDTRDKEMEVLRKELNAGHDYISATELDVRGGPIDIRINELVGVIMNDIHRVYDAVGKMLEDLGNTPIAGLPGDKIVDITMRRLAQLQESHKAQIERTKIDAKDAIDAILRLISPKEILDLSNKQPPISTGESWLACLNAARNNQPLPADHLAALRSWLKKQDPPKEWKDKALEIAHTPGLAAAGWDLYWILSDEATVF